MPAMIAAQFPQFFAANRPTRPTSPQDLINLSQKRKYLVDLLIRGKSPWDIAKGGDSTIEDKVVVADNGGAEWYNPGDQSDFGPRGTSYTLTTRYRNLRSPVTWTETEFKRSTSNGEYERVKDFRKMKRQESFTTHMNELDASLFRLPSYDDMEAAPTNANPGKPLSIPAIISHDTTRYCPPSSAWGTQTLFGQNPATYSWHRNQVETYNAANLFDPEEGLLSAMDKMQLDVRWVSPNGAGDLMQNSDISRFIIPTNKLGFTKLQQIGRAAQDRWADPTDGSMGFPKWDGAPIVHAEDLDTVYLDQTIGASAAYTNQPFQNPVFYFINRMHFGPVFDPAGIMVEGDPLLAGARQPDTYVVWRTSSLNFFCNDRRKHGIVAAA